MLAALIALLLGGAAFALGGGGGGSSGTAPLASRGSEEDEDDTPQASPSEGNTPDIAASEYALDWGGLTGEEQMMVELINRARLDVSEEVQLQNEGLASGISSGDKAPLAVVQTLSNAARDHSEDMDDRQFFDHYDPEGVAPWDRAVEAGHSTTYVGENIAVISSSNTNFDEQGRVESLHAGLWESDGHQRNMLRDDWSEIGAGYDYGSYSGLNGGTYVTTKFSDTGETYLTGVVIDDTDDDDFYDLGEGQGGVRITAVDTADAENVFTTSTWASGGYTLALPSGTYRVVFEGGDLSAAQEALVTIGDENVKLDIIEGDGRVGDFASAIMVPEGAEAMAMLPALPPIEEGEMVELEAEDDLEPMLL